MDTTQRYIKIAEAAIAIREARETIKTQRKVIGKYITAKELYSREFEDKAVGQAFASFDEDTIVSLFNGSAYLRRWSPHDFRNAIGMLKTEDYAKLLNDLSNTDILEA